MAAQKARVAKKDEEVGNLTKQLEEAKKGSVQSTHEVSMKYFPASSCLTSDMHLFCNGFLIYCRLQVAEGKLVEAEREAKRANDQLGEKSKQYEALKAEFDPLFNESAELKKKLNAKDKELKVSPQSNYFGLL